MLQITKTRAIYAQGGKSIDKSYTSNFSLIVGDMISFFKKKYT